MDATTEIKMTTYTYDSIACFKSKQKAQYYIDNAANNGLLTETECYYAYVEKVPLRAMAKGDPSTYCVMVRQAWD